MSALRAGAGRPYDAAVELASRVAAFEERPSRSWLLRSARHVDADVHRRQSPARLSVDVERGPRVRVVFAGDPLPAEPPRHAGARSARSAASTSICSRTPVATSRAYLRQQGYRSAKRAYVREERDGEMVLTFTVDRGPLHRLGAIEVTGNQSVPLADIAPLLALKPGEPFVDSRVATVANAVAELYRVRGYVRVGVKPEIAIGPSAADGARPVDLRLVVTEGQRRRRWRRDDHGDARGAGGDDPRAPRAAAGAAVLPAAARRRSRSRRAALSQPRLSKRARRRPDRRLERRRADRDYLGRPGGCADDHRPRAGERQCADQCRADSPRGRPAAWTAAWARTRSSRGSVVLPHLACSGACAWRNCRTVRATGRDILIEVEEAPATTVGYGGGVEAGRRAAHRRRRPGGRSDRSRAAGLLRAQPPQSCGARIDRSACSRASACARATRRSIRPIQPIRAATASMSIASLARSASRGRSTGRATCSSPCFSSRRSARASTSRAAASRPNTRVASATNSR